MDRTYIHSYASLAGVIVALVFGAHAALQLWSVTTSTIPGIEALKPLEPAQTWRFVEPLVKEGVNGQFVQERISGLVGDAVLLQENWKRYAENHASRLRWEVAAWSAVFICSLTLFLTRVDGKNSA